MCPCFFVFQRNNSKRRRILTKFFVGVKCVTGNYILYKISRGNLDGDADLGSKRIITIAGWGQ